MIDTQYGVVSPSDVLNTNTFKMHETRKMPGWFQELQAFEGDEKTHTPETEEYGISSFIYSAERPFHKHRLAAFAKTDISSWGVLRSKGVAWCDSDYDVAKEWSSAGSSMALHPGRRWLDWRDADEKYQDRQHGDRRQEIVFIGQNMKESEIRSKLDAALMSEQEYCRWQAGKGQPAWKRQRVS